MNDKHLSTTTKLGLAITAYVMTIMPASADLMGGINTTKSIAQELQTGMMAIGGVIAVIYLLWKALEAWRGRCDWGEFALSVGYVAVAGASVALAGWAWDVFTN